MNRSILFLLVLALGIGTMISWYLAGDSGVPLEQWRLMYESKNDRSMRLVPLFLIVGFSLMAIAAILSAEERPSKRFINRPEPTETHDFQEEGG